MKEDDSCDELFPSQCPLCGATRGLCMLIQEGKVRHRFSCGTLWSNIKKKKGEVEYRGYKCEQKSVIREE